MSGSGDSLGELKVEVSVDLDVAQAHAVQAKVARDAVATQTAAAKQAESAWNKAVQAMHAQRSSAGASALGGRDSDIDMAVGELAKAVTAQRELARQSEREEAARARTIAALKQQAALGRIESALGGRDSDIDMAAGELAKASQAVVAHRNASTQAADATRARWRSAAHQSGLAIAGAFAAGTAAVAAFAHEMLASGLAIDRQARSLGLSTDEVQRWRYVAEQAGLEGDALGEAVGGFAQRANEAAQHGGDAAKRFRDLGITLEDAQGGVRPLNALMLDAADALQRMGPGTEQTGTALALFGEKGRMLLPVLGRGRAGVEALTREFDALGGGLDEGAIAEMVAFDRETNRVKVALTSALMPAVRELLRGVQGLVDEMRPAIESFRDMSANSHLVRAGLLTLGATAAGVGVAMLVAFGPVVATFLAITAAALVAGFALDDVITTFEGGDSVIRRFVDGLWGVGATAKIVEEFRDAWEGLNVTFAQIDQMSAGVESLADSFEPLRVVLDAIKASLSFVAQNLPALIAQVTGTTGLRTAFTGLGALGHVARQDQQRVAQGAGLYTSPITAGTGARILATPQQAAFNFAQNPGGQGPVSVANNSRVQVQIDGVLDPGSQAFLTRVQNIVQETLEANTQTTLQGITKSGGTRRGRT